MEWYYAAMLVAYGLVNLSALIWMAAIDAKRPYKGHIVPPPVQRHREGKY